MARWERSKLRIAGAAAPAHLVPVGLFVVIFLVGLGAGELSAPTLGPVAASADQPLAVLASAERAYITGADSRVYCPIVLQGWFPNAPIITKFTAEPGTISFGEATKLSWSIKNPVDMVTLEPGAGVVTVLDTYMFSPQETTTYILTAQNRYGSASAQVTVLVRREPADINSFTADPATIALGQSSTLKWSVAGDVDSLRIEPDVGDVTGETSVLVAPTETTIYSLIASSVAGSAERKVTLTVVPSPEITSFAADPATIGIGQKTTLSWLVSNPVEKLTLEPGVGDVTGVASVELSPAETTTYVLTAENIGGSDTREAVVSVLEPPQITDFGATPPSISLGNETTLSWLISGTVDSLTLEPGTIDVTGQTTLVISPTETTTYTLTATNLSGFDSAEATVTVNQPPVITSFGARPNTIGPGGYSRLSWTVANPVTSLTLKPGPVDVTGLVEVTVSPTETTTYRLFAVNDYGEDRAQKTVVLDPTIKADEMLIYDWDQDRPVEKRHSGFPRTVPHPLANDDWTTPINFAQGTMLFRVQIFSMPVTEGDMKLQFCVWQNDYTGEECGSKHTVSRTPGTDPYEWQTKVENMKGPPGSLPIDWQSPRQIWGVAIKNMDSDPVSDLGGHDWAGEDPDEWYPLVWRFTVVVLAEGAKFSGWENYID